MSWERDGRSNTVVTSLNKATPPEAPDTVEECGRCTTGPQAHTDISAILSLVARIGFEDFWFTSDGGYRGPTMFCKSLLDVKASFAAECPDVEPFSSDWNTVMTNAAWLQSQASKGDGCPKKGFMLPSRRLKFRHVIFEIQ